jgi:hypothetical protein
MRLDFDFKGGSFETYFRIIKCNNGEYELNKINKLFNIEDYYIYKGTYYMKKVSIEEYYELEYSSYMFLKKRQYKIEDVEIWVNYIRDNKIRILFFERPFPNFNPNDRIKFIKYEDL